jgi:hypothetical protein
VEKVEKFLEKLQAVEEEKAKLNAEAEAKAAAEAEALRKSKRDQLLIIQSTERIISKKGVSLLEKIEKIEQEIRAQKVSQGIEEVALNEINSQKQTIRDFIGKINARLSLLLEGEKPTEEITQAATSLLEEMSKMESQQIIATCQEVLENIKNIAQGERREKVIKNTEEKLDSITRQFEKIAKINDPQTRTSRFLSYFNKYTEKEKSELNNLKIEFFSNIKLLANLEPDIDKKIAIYKNYLESPVINTHRNSGFFSLGRTASKITLEKALVKLESQKQQQAQPLIKPKKP